MKLTTQVHLFWNTVRYLTPSQIWYRGRRLVRRRWWQLRSREAPQPVAPPLMPFTALYIGLASFLEVKESVQLTASFVKEARAIADGTFHFLNQPRTLSASGWHDETLSQLWRYHLHYFDYVLPLLIWSRVAPSEQAFDTFEALASSWIAHNRRLQGDGWHPYTISLRTVNWLQAAAGFASQLQGTAFEQRFLSSLYGQVQMLHDDLELDVRGNHLLENLRALIWAGLAFEGKEAVRWLARGLSLLELETAEQILPDGGHFERVPGYHLVVLKNYLEIALALERNGHVVPNWLVQALERMFGYLITILPADGQLPLLKDTAWSAAPTAADLLAAGALYFEDPSLKRSKCIGAYPLLLFGAEAWKRLQQWPVNREVVPSILLPDSGYGLFRDDKHRDYLIVDVGDPCPDYLPAHSHADLLSFELVVEGQRVAVDSGVYEYQAGNWRNYFRSTRAHNTVEIDGQDQSEIWGSFRLARRAWPTLLQWQVEEHAERGEIGLLRGRHNGYRRLRTPVIHERTIFWLADRLWLVFDELQGSGIFPQASYLHLHPSLTLQQEKEKLWQISGVPGTLWLSHWGAEEATVVSGQMEPRLQGWYSEGFGDIEANSVLMLTCVQPLPVRLGYVLAKREPARVSVASNGSQLMVEHHRDCYVIRINQETAMVDIHEAQP